MAPGNAQELSNATFRIAVPRTATTTNRRAPRYISAATKSVKISLTNPDIGAQGTTQLDVTAGSAPCPADAAQPGNSICTLTVRVPPGKDTFTIAAYDATNATGNLISQQILTVTVAAGVQNTIPVVLDANPSTITVAAPAGAPLTGTVPAGLTIFGSWPVVFAVSVKDAHGTVLTGNAIAGSPVLSATSSNPSAMAVSVSQNPYAVTLTGGSLASSQITVTAKPNGAADGLSASQLQFSAKSADLVAVSNGSVFSYDGTGLTSYGSVTPASEVGFDAAGKLYNYNSSSGNIDVFDFAAIGNSAAARTIATGVTSTNALIPMDVAPDGTVVVVGDDANNQIVRVSPGGTAPSLGRNFGAVTKGDILGTSAAAVYDPGYVFGQPAGTAVGFATIPWDAKIGTTYTYIAAIADRPFAPSMSAQTCTPGSTSCYELDINRGPGVNLSGGARPTLAYEPWPYFVVADNNAANNGTGDVWQIQPYRNGPGGEFIVRGLPVNTGTGGHIRLATSKGSRVAIEWKGATGAMIRVYDRPGTSASESSTRSMLYELTLPPAMTFPARMRFLHDGSLAVCSANGTRLSIYGPTGTAVATTSLQFGGTAVAATR